MRKCLSLRAFTALSAGALGFLMFQPSSAVASYLVPQTRLNPTTIPQFVDPLPQPATLDGMGKDHDDDGKVWKPKWGNKKTFNINMHELNAQILPQTDDAGNPTNFGPTAVWGYNRAYPGPTIEARRGVRTTIRYRNKIPYGDRSLVQQLLTVDQTLHWADPLNLGPTMGVTCSVPPALGDDPHCFPYQGPMPTVPHLHGGETPSRFDGGPDQWWTSTGIRGDDYHSRRGARSNEAIYRYWNDQEAATLWYHDHALGATRINVFAGLAGFYIVRDPANEPRDLPGGPADNCPTCDREIIIQDRSFDTNSQLYFPDGSNPAADPMTPPNPDIHPFWIPEFVGDVIVVNGKSWPYLDVRQRRYRFRLLNGSNARHYNLKICAGTDFCATAARPMWIIATDGGYLDQPVSINELVLGPSERAEVIVDFSGLSRGTKLYLVNNAPIPFGGVPGGLTTVEQNTVGRIIQFRMDQWMCDRSCNPANTCDLRPKNPIIRLDPAVTPPDITRQLTLNEFLRNDVPLQLLLNNTRWNGLDTNGNPIAGSVQIGQEWVTELPQVGATELWELINITVDTHPIHLHLVQFQLLNRETFDTAAYQAAYDAALAAAGKGDADGPPNQYDVLNVDGAIGGNPAVSPYLSGIVTTPSCHESGWKDTIQAHPGEVTRIMVRYAPTYVPLGASTAGVNQYPFNPTAGPGYVWHCHILDHEDNEMMRSKVVRRISQLP